MRPSSTIGIALALVLTAACGAKTGLDVPPFDAGMPDAGTDAGLDVPCVEVPLDDAGIVELPLDLEAQLARADVLFLVDTTASMNEEIEEIRQGLRDRIAPGIASAIPDSALGVATFADFPVMSCGEALDVPFQLNREITQDLSQVQAAVDGIGRSNGVDRPEAQVEALYQVATGEGLDPFIQPSLGCPGGGFGYPCFRDGALPVVLMFTDAPFHNGPGGTNPYRCPLAPAVPHTYEQAIDRLGRLDVRVIGMYSGDGTGRGDLEQLATDTAATGGDGSPLVFDIGLRGERLSDSVVNAIRTFADVIEFDVDTFLVDPDPGDGVDVTQFVEAVIPVRAVPMDRIRGIDTATGTFLGVRAGTRVVFVLQIRAGVIMPGPEPQRFRLEVVFRGNGRTRLGSRIVDIVIPGTNGEGCDAN
ncbi:MAG: vWA domain-containing protein [Sandaracinaceae bacterium]